jgi:cobalt/nickel transport system permease protein
MTITASLACAIISLQLGAFSVVLQTVFSGISGLPFSSFVLLMQPIHLAIGIVEGLVTAGVVVCIGSARPEVIQAAYRGGSLGPVSVKKVIIGLLIATGITGGLLSWFASSNPDGLEWAMFKTSGKEELESRHAIHTSLASLQEKTAFMPDYGFKKSESEAVTEPQGEPSWPAIDPGTTVAGIVGGAVTLLIAFFVGWVFRQRKTVVV